MKSIKPFWFDGNGYHLFLIDGWKIKTIFGASKYLTGMKCGEGRRNEYHHLFEPYSEFYFPDGLYSVFWPEGIFRKGTFDPFKGEVKRSNEKIYGWFLLFNGEANEEFKIPDEKFRNLLFNRLSLIDELKNRLKNQRDK